ncbi:MAG: hypothetical protein RL701_2655, partial [Pseudomonadota bacterium]
QASSDDGATVGNLAFVPNFPGAGKSGADAPLVGGQICDYKPRSGQKGLQPFTECFYGPGQTLPIATIEEVLECVAGVDAVHLRLTLDPAFVDNTYGDNAIDWGEQSDPTVPPMAAAPAPGANAGPMAMPPAPGKKAGMAPAAKPGKPGKRGHTWMDLVGSDHAELLVKNAAGDVVSHFKLDYISQDPTAPSGYSSAGVLGGDGKMLEGAASDIVDWRTSIERNLNERGYGSYTVDSPATDSDYTPNSATPGWDYRVVYEAWIDNAAFGASGFGTALIENVHASPSKASSDTITVTPGPCPPCAALDDGCVPPPPDTCIAVGPDDYHCGDAGLPPPPPDQEPTCKQHPDDPLCTPE